jgi:hypothetical protein
MLLEFELQRCTRRCAATDRELAPGDLCYSVLEEAGAGVVRRDFSPDGWTGAPDDAIGWWKSRIPEPTAKKIKLAPNDVLLELFESLADRPEQSDLRYVLALLLIRRRVLRVDIADGNVGPTQPVAEENTLPTMLVYCPKREAIFEVQVDMPSGERVDEIQQQLSELLIADAE